MTTLERALLQGVEALEAVGLRYAIVGGLAVAAWGYPRATRDVDLYAELPPDKRAAVQHELEVRGFHVPAMDEELSRFGVFRSRASAGGVFLDVFDAVGPLGEAILQRRRRIETMGRALWFISAADLAVLKVFSDRARDFDDLVVLLCQSAIAEDLSYVQDWAKQLDASIGSNEISERLQRALAEAARRSR